MLFISSGSAGSRSLEVELVFVFSFLIRSPADQLLASYSARIEVSFGTVIRKKG